MQVSIYEKDANTYYVLNGRQLMFEGSKEDCQTVAHLVTDAYNRGVGDATEKMRAVKHDLSVQTPITGFEIKQFEN